MNKYVNKKERKKEQKKTKQIAYVYGCSNKDLDLLILDVS